jgi:hypothetical protein
MTTLTRPLTADLPNDSGLPSPVADFLPIVVGPAAAWAAGQFLPPWIAMWCMAFAVYFGLKWLVWRRTRATLTGRTLRRFGTWFLLWPGMNPAPFFPTTSATVPLLATARLATTRREWLVAALKTAVGLAMLGVVGPYVLPYSSFIGGWIGIVGLILLLHSGSFHLAALAWRHAGVAVEPLMGDPLRATSLADFWGRRWNRAFRDLVDPLIFRPLVRRRGPRVASWGVFLFSGLVHDLVITVPAGGGYGLPTLYFLLQAAVLELTHSAQGKKWNLRSGLRARLIAVITLVAPLGLLAPRPFVENCIVPMVRLWGN